MIAESTQSVVEVLLPLLRTAAGWTLRTGVEAAVVALLVLAAQRLLRERISARWRHNLWLLVLARLVLPAVPQSAFSPFNYLPAVSSSGSPTPAEIAQAPKPTPAKVGPAAIAPRAPENRAARIAPPQPPRVALPAVTKRPPDVRQAAPPDLARSDSHEPIESTLPAPVAVESPEVTAERPLSPPQIEVAAKTVAPPVSPASAMATPMPAPPPYRFSTADVLAITWGAIAVFLLLRIGWASIRLALCVRRLPRIQDPAIHSLLDEALRQISIQRLRRPSLRLAPEGCGPAVVGILRPKILLPTYVLDQFSREELRNVLLHELAHIRRHDVAINWLLCILRAIHWFNPAVWFTGRRIVLEREQACDQAVLAAQSRAETLAAPASDAPPAYGATLIKLMELLRGSTCPGTGRADRRAAALVGMVGVLDPAPRSWRRGTHLKQLQRRLAMIARFDPAAPSRRRWMILSAGLTMLIGGVALTGAVRAQASPAAGAPPAADHGAAAPAATDPNAVAGPPPRPTPPAKAGATSPGAADHEHAAAPAVEPATPVSLTPAAEAELQTLELELKAKVREFEVYQSTLKRMQALSRQGSIGTADVDRAEIDAVKAEAEVARAKLRLEQFRNAQRTRPATPRPLGSTTWDPPAVAAITPGPVGMPAGGVGVPNDELNIVEDETTSAANATAMAKLRTPIGKIALENLPLSDALASLADRTKLDILADWQSIEAMGLAKDSIVSLKLSGEFPAEQVLRWTLRTVGGDGLGFWIDHGVVTITTQDRLSRVTITRMYEPRDTASKKLMEEMKTLVSPGSWRETGGMGAIVWVDDRVLITQTGPNHRQIERLLSMVQQKGAKAAPAAPGEGMQIYREALRVEQTDPALALARYKEVKRLLPPDAWPSDLDARIQRVEERLKRAADGH